MADLDSSPNEHLPPLSIEDLASYKNEPLPPSEALVARPWLLDAEAELARIDEEIRRLEARRSAVLTPAKVYRVALAPHKILPEDVLREIFLWATFSQYYWGPPTADLNATLSGDPNVRLVIGRVSSHWRVVSLDMPELWSDVRVEIPDEEAFKLRLLNMIDLWLGRSGHHPISLDIGLARDPCVAPLLMRYSHRIRCLSVDCLEPLVALAVSMDLLERFDVQGRYASIPDASISVLSRSPRLRSVTLCSLSDGYPVNLKPLGIPWHQLTELHLEGIPRGVLQSHHMLAQCTALTWARLDIFEDSDNPGLAIARRIALPGLRKLALDGLTLPSLTELILYGPEGWGPKHSAMYTIDTFPAVRRLVVHNVDYDEDGDPEWLVPWFRSCPSALDVWLPGYTMPTPLLTQIADGSLLPNLEMILLHYAELPPLLAALQARQRSLNHSTITTVGIRESDRFTPSEREGFAKLMELGVCLAYYEWDNEHPIGEVPWIPYEICALLTLV
ncbi:hypothetical protein FB451DRAFT_1256143 [Mycena latifolia]|nr:hypothetical protein FB451DRAFT_1256143 [Mycena latifolia]